MELLNYVLSIIFLLILFWAFLIVFIMWPIKVLVIMGASVFIYWYGKRYIE